MNCVICYKTLSFWNQPILNKGELKTKEKVCSVCYLKINNKSPQFASNLKQVSPEDVKKLLGISHEHTSVTPPIIKPLTDNVSGGKQLSEKLQKILKSKTNLSSIELDKLTESDGWAIIYSMGDQKKEKLIEICFTGFSPADKYELINTAKKNNLHVTSSVTRNLYFLCVGDNAGAVKVKKAKEQNTKIISKEQLLELLETGQLPV